MQYLFGLIAPVTLDAPEPWLIGFQDGASPTFEGLVDLHGAIFFYLVLIALGVAWVMGAIAAQFNAGKAPIAHRYANHGTLIEVVWTVTPALVLVAIAFPSFKLLYLMDGFRRYQRMCFLALPVRVSHLVPHRRKTMAAHLAIHKGWLSCLTCGLLNSLRDHMRRTLYPGL